MSAARIRVSLPGPTNRATMQETVQLILLTVMTGLLWLLVSRQRGLEQRLKGLERLDEIKKHVAKLSDSGAGLDLRRLEHVLIDIRDGQKRLSERLLQLAESAHREGVTETEIIPAAREPERHAGSSLGERITNRLLAMGYERIQLLSSTAELAELIDEDGEVGVEARRDGAACKGRISIRGGTIADVELKSTHTMFP